MKLKEFKKQIYKNISDYWNIVENDEQTNKYKVVNIILGLPDILKFINFNKFGLLPVHIEYLDYFYDFRHKTASPSLTEEEQKIFENEKKDENVQSKISEKIKIRAKIRKKKREIEDKIYEIKRNLRICVYSNIAKKHGGGNLDGEREVENYVFDEKLITNEQGEILEKYMQLKILEKNHGYKKILDEANKTIDIVSKQIKELTKKRYVKITITDELKNKRQNIEEKYLKILFKFLKARKLLPEFLKEISKNYKNYEFKRIRSFYTTPIKEAKDRLAGELPLTKQNIISTGYYPFTTTKIERQDVDEIKEIEINWWVKFLKSGKDVLKDGFQIKGFDFLKQIDLYNDIEN